MKIKKNTDQSIISWSDTIRISNENMGEKGFKNEGAGK